MDIVVPHATQKLIEFICVFLSRHADAPVVADFKLSDWDKEQFSQLEGTTLVNLLKVPRFAPTTKASHFLGSQFLFNATSAYIGYALASKDQQAAQDYLGISHEPTTEDANALKARYPLPFF